MSVWQAIPAFEFVMHEFSSIKLVLLDVTFRQGINSTDNAFLLTAIDDLHT